MSEGDAQWPKPFITAGELSAIKGITPHLSGKTSLLLNSRLQSLLTEPSLLLLSAPQPIYWNWPSAFLLRKGLFIFLLTLNTCTSTKLKDLHILSYTSPYHQRNAIIRNDLSAHVAEKVASLTLKMMLKQLKPLQMICASLMRNVFFKSSSFKFGTNISKKQAAFIMLFLVRQSTFLSYETT